jgi:Porin subfamily
MFKAVHQDVRGIGSGGLFRPRWLSLSKFLGRGISAVLLVLSCWIVSGGANDASAKPVEYVKICSLYGAGFFYIPGTDSCIKLGGHLRAEATGTYTEQPVPNGLSGLSLRTSAYYVRETTCSTTVGSYFGRVEPLLQNNYCIGLSPGGTYQVFVPGLAPSNPVIAQNPSWSSNQLPVRFYGQLLLGGGQNTFYDTTTRDSSDFNRIRTGFDEPGIENRTANGWMFGGAVGITGSTTQQGWTPDIRFTGLWSNTENRVSINTSKVLDGLYLVTAGIQYSSPTVAGTNLPFFASFGVGGGGATFGIKREDGTDLATSFTVAAIADLGVQVYPTVYVGVEWIGFHTNTADFDRRSIGYYGNDWLLAVRKNF